MPTAIWRLLLWSGSAHCDLAFAAGVRCDLALAVEFGSAHCDLAFAVVGRGEREGVWDSLYNNSRLIGEENIGINRVPDCYGFWSVGTSCEPRSDAGPSACPAASRPSPRRRGAASRPARWGGSWSRGAVGTVGHTSGGLPSR